MIEERIQRLAQQIADDQKLQKFGLDPHRLAAAISAALEEYEGDRLLWSHRDGSAALAPELRRVSMLARRTLLAWRGTPQQAREFALEFVDGASAVDHIDERLTFVDDLLSELEKHYSRQVGNPGKSRADANVDLRPLDGFVSVLMDFWVSETGTPAGHKVETADELDGCIRDAVSPFMTMLTDVGAGALSPSPYTAANYETVVRRLKRDGQGT